MKPNPQFLCQPMEFWANVRSISESVGYSAHGKGKVGAPGLDAVLQSLAERGLGTSHIISRDGKQTAFGAKLLAYFEYRAQALNECVEPNLMDAEQAAKAFEQVRAATNSRLVAPMNKQKGEKKQPAFLTAMVNMLVHASIGKHSCDFDPRKLTTFTRDGSPLRTLARRVDGAFPSTINPIAIWEIKEYYYTTTFGSRVADGVYETLLDGMEIQEMRLSEDVGCKHYLIVDAYYTWWKCGRSYLCRIIDMLHMGYIDEVIVGREVIARIPELAREWVAKLEGCDAEN